MAKRIIDRYATMDELAAALGTYLKEKSATSTTRLTPPGRRGRPWPILAAGVAAVALAVATVLWLHFNRDRAPVIPPSGGPGGTGAGPGELPPPLRSLIATLEDRDVLKRQAAAVSLEQQNVMAAVPALVRRVSDDVWDGVAGPGGERDPSKDAALSALKHLGPDQVTGALRLAVKSSNPAVRAWACDRLGEQSDLAATEVLYPALVDARVAVRARAALALQRRQDPAAGLALSARVADDLWENDAGPNRDSSKEAALAALKALAPDKVAKALEAALKSKNQAVQDWARTQRALLPGVGRHWRSSPTEKCGSVSSTVQASDSSFPGCVSFLCGRRGAETKSFVTSQ